MKKILISSLLWGCSVVLAEETDMICEKLSPLYQRVFTCALSKEQQEQVIAFTKKGQNPYNVIDAILQRDRMAHEKKPEEEKLSPAERSMRRKNSSYVIMKK